LEFADGASWIDILCSEGINPLLELAFQLKNNFPEKWLPRCLCWNNRVGSTRLCGFSVLRLIVTIELTHSLGTPADLAEIAQQSMAFWVRLT
jgi:hypothetical protein